MPAEMMGLRMPAIPAASSGVAERIVRFTDVIISTRTTMAPRVTFSTLPSVDRALQSEEAQALARIHGRALVTESIRLVLDEMRTELRDATGTVADPATSLMARVRAQLEAQARPTLR